MGIQWSEESYFSKEMKRWDAPKRAGGMNANGFEPFPLMLYKTQEHPISHRHEVAADKDIPTLDGTRVLFDAQAFNTSCQLIVKNEEELDRARREGWRGSQAEALKYRDDELGRQAEGAAHRNYLDRNMSEKAQAEAQAAEEKISGHVAEIPQKPTDPALAQRRRESLAKARDAKAAKKAATTA